MPRTQSEDTRRKISEAMRGNRNRAGRKNSCSEETRRKISATKKGVRTGRQSDDTIQKIRDAWTPEKRAEISARRRGVRYGRPADGISARAERYVVLTGQWDHPIAVKGVLAEHRKVLYDAIGPGPHACHWECGKILEWGGRSPTSIMVDHLDGDIHNNDPGNLVPSCNVCNIHRRAA